MTRTSPCARRSARRAVLRVLLAVIGVAALLPAAAGANAPVSGAAFTTTNTAVDGTGHCKNGNEAVNCNIYDGKDYVWLNGGPSVAYVGDGDYFFAVLDPGGQANPNDGSAKLLSTDSYTDRTFQVSGGTVAYSGTHDFDTNKIRLQPYDDTSNPGGVYILAICSLADGYPVDPSACKYDAFKVLGPGVGLPLTVTKDANGTFDHSYAWTIAKDVDKTVVKQVGGSATFNYTVTATRDGGTVSNVHVTGTITVANPNVDDQNVTTPVSGVTVGDTLSDGTVCTVANGSDQTLTAFETQFTYSCDLTTLPDASLDNTVTVSWPDQTLDNGDVLDAGSADFTFADIGFAENAIDECVNVTDSFSGTLGTVCLGDANPKTFTYGRTIPVGTGCTSYDNTATFTANDTGATGSASQTVRVCGPSQTGALTIGFWKTTNGTSLIQNYCAPAGKTSLATYLAGLGGGSGPFSDAAGKSCSQLVTYAGNVLKGASATNMNVMLRAQMLGTALDVYFSGPGYTTTAVGKTKPPSSFLPGVGIGSFVMDMTAICPMVDSTTTGTATCAGSTPSTDGFASGAFPAAAMSVQALLDYEATTPSPFNGSVTNPVWYGGDRTKEEIAKNAFDQINNQLAFGA